MRTNQIKFRKLYIECGTTLKSPVNTGIQRVVRNIINVCGDVTNEYGFSCEFLAFEPSGFMHIPSVERSPRQGNAKRAILACLRKFDRRFQENRFFWFYGNGRNILKDFVRAVFSEKSAPQPICWPSEVSPDMRPVLLLLDSTWDNAIWPHVDEFRKNGGVVCAVLYDLIPFSHPDTVDETTRILHTSWWSLAPRYVDAIICISQSVRQDYLAWQTKECPSNPLPLEKVGYFYLGAELANTDPFARLLIEDAPYFLMVGSLEPRKNHKTVLDAFEQLWAQGVTVRLVIIGGYGWKSEDLLDRIHHHAQLNQLLFLIRDASDRDLIGLYGKAAGLIIASLAEGFGLPIVEAFEHHTPVICSDIPVFHEVAGDRARYFEALDPTSLADKVLALIQENGGALKGVKPNSQRWITWRQSAQQLLDQISHIVK